MSKERILEILKRNNGSFCSGEQMSRELGISRAAISKAVGSLRADGYEITSVTNRGYKLINNPNLLSEGTIRPWLKRELGDKLIVLESVDSTNSYLKRLALDGAADGTVAVADEQTGGRGRMGRSFQSPAGNGIYISFLMKPNVLPQQAVDLTSYAAVAMCDAIETAIGIRPQIKWTNDVLLNKKKVCGILTEMSVEGETGALQYVVLGIGVNCKQREEDFPEEIRHIAGSISMATDGICDRGKLTAEIINAMDQLYHDWLSGKPVVDRYRADCATIGREVRVIRASGEKNAFAMAVEDDFSLLVRYEDGTEERVFSGEVSVRGLEGYV